MVDTAVMNRIAKIILYAVLLMAAVYFFKQFRREYAEATLQATMAQDSKLGTDPGENTSTNKPVSEEAADPTPGLANSETNLAPAATNTLSDASTNAVGTGSTASAKAPTGKASATWPMHLGAFVAALLVLAGFLGWDVSKAIASKANSVAFDEDSDVEKDPDYDSAEQVNAQGDHLEAIRLLREFLKKNSSEQYAAIRIAEIYEKDLNNPVAAAMEYEEILTRKLPREKWGWTAIHLANLYSGKMNQADKAITLLERINHDYPETGAARKARQRLGLPEPEEVETAAGAENVSPPAEEEPPSNLPRGFKPKK